MQIELKAKKSDNHHLNYTISSSSGKYLCGEIAIICLLFTRKVGISHTMNCLWADFFMQEKLTICWYFVRSVSSDFFLLIFGIFFLSPRDMSKFSNLDRSLKIFISSGILFEWILFGRKTEKRISITDQIIKHNVKRYQHEQHETIGWIVST